MHWIFQKFEIKRETMSCEKQRICAVDYVLFVLWIGFVPPTVSWRFTVWNSDSVSLPSWLWHSPVLYSTQEGNWSWSELCRYSRVVFILWCYCMFSTRETGLLISFRLLSLQESHNKLAFCYVFSVAFWTLAFLLLFIYFFGHCRIASYIILIKLVLWLITFQYS